ncbi:MAG: carboxypeptidase regulatory-like domain-containing protein [Flavobacteriaceae bacterium]|nr:carboxypeptidase regulatory-like domain-containing protein [Flavobacteriaceae bacterium]
MGQIIRHPVVKIVFFLTVLILFISCSKENPEITAFEEVSGNVQLYDMDGNEYSDNSGAIVSLEGTSISTTTNTNGKWVISGLDPGTYTIKIGKQGFGTVKIYDARLYGGYTSVDPVSVFPIPAYKVTLTSAYNLDDNGFSITAFYTGNLPLYPSIHLFFGKKSNVSSEPLTYDQELFYSTFGATESVEFQLSFSKLVLLDSGFKSKDSVYVTAYTDYGFRRAYNSIEPIWYLDLDTNTLVYPNLNPEKSTTLSFILP